MPRIRTVKPEFWGDEKLAPLSPIDRLVFLGLISMADDAGRVVDSVRAIDGFIFPETEDASRESLDRLDDLGRIERGITASGQQVIQITNWNHQKIDKPNFAAALPPIALAAASSNGRRSIPAKLRLAIIERDGGVCVLCSVVVRPNKVDRYDSGPDLAEIDHILPVADGGTNDPQNLRLLCLACNRKKGGEDAARRNAERSATDRRNVADASTPHINDQRSTTGDPLPANSDPLPPTAAATRTDWRTALGVTGQPLLDAMAELTAKLGGGPSAGRTVEDFIGQAPTASRFAWTRSLISALDPLGGQRVEADVLLRAMEDFLIADRAKWPWVARVFRAFVDDVAKPRAEKIRRGEAITESEPEDALARWAREADARERAITHA